MPKGKVYLGNRVFAERWNDGIILTVYNNDDVVIERIYLDLSTYDALLTFKADMDEEIAAEREEAHNG